MAYKVEILLNELVDMELKQMDEILKELKKNLACAQNQTKNHFDKGMSMKSFELKDWVFLKHLPRKHKVLSKAALNKLRDKYFFPYRVLEKCRLLAYKLDLSAGVHIHPIFHVS